MNVRILNVDGTPVCTINVGSERAAWWSPFRVAVAAVGVVEMLVGAVLLARLL